MADGSHRHEVLAEQLAGAVYVETLDTSSAAYISRRIEELTGYTPSQWTADPNFFERVLHPDDRERVIAAFAEAHEQLQPLACEYRIIHADGRAVWVRDDARIAYDADGTPLHIQGYMTDITERKTIEANLDEARERFRSLAEQLPLVIYIDDPSPDGRSMYVSPQIEHLVGVTAEEWVANPETFAAVLHPDDRDRVLERTRRGRAEHLPFENEYRLVGPSGKTVWVHDAAMPVGDAGAPRYWQGYVIDISERKAIEEQREQLLELERAQNERLREVDAMKDEFVALVSHELRTPLTAIQGYTEMVVDGTAGDVNDEQRMMLGSVVRNTARLLHIVNDLLFVAQLSSGGSVSVQLTDVDLGEVAAEAVSDAHPRAKAAGVTLELKVDVTSPPVIQADPVRLGQVFDNLISNAIKFTPTGGVVRLTISMAGDDAVIVITDSGMGMSPDDQQRLFTRFFRTKEASRIQGTGLGLTITKAIIEAHHGSISVESEVGLGTSFTVTVPTAAAV